jgi:hypothetical protein
MTEEVKINLHEKERDEIKKKLDLIKLENRKAKMLREIEIHQKPMLKMEIDNIAGYVDRLMEVDELLSKGISKRSATKLKGLVRKINTARKRLEDLEKELEEHDDTEEYALELVKKKDISNELLTVALESEEIFKSNSADFSKIFPDAEMYIREALE